MLGDEGPGMEVEPIPAGWGVSTVPSSLHPRLFLWEHKCLVSGELTGEETKDAEGQM